MSGMTMRTSRRTTRRGRIHPLQIVETRSDLFSTVWSLSSDSNTCNSNIQTRISMSFDRMGRRVEYLETADIDGITTTNTHHRFVYDGYLCIQRLDAAANNAIDLIFAWDPAEPVATRPLMIEKPNVCKLHVTHDGNKNVSDLVFFNGGSGVAAHYEYAPFGALTRAVGESTFSNPWRFSSECFDDDVVMVCYNYRHYDPNNGRWMSRDANEDLGVLNLYLWLNNDVFDVDVCGLSPLTDALSKYFNPMAAGSFSKDIFRAPLGPGFVVLTFSVNASIYDCCSAEVNSQQSWISADLTGELYYELGVNIDYPSKKKTSQLRREQGYDKKACKKDQMMPHPCEPGKMINIANYNKVASECRKKSRKIKSGGTAGGSLRVCPTKEGWDWGGGFFIKISAGVGLGVIVDGRVDVTELLLEGKGFKSLSGSVQRGWVGVVGASVDAGGWLSASWQNRIN